MNNPQGKASPKDHAATSEENPSKRKDSSPRRTDFDVLRGIAMLLGLVLHALMSFLPSSWPVQDSRQNDLFFIPVAIVHMFRMQLFFLLSGFFAMFILQKQGLRGMLAHRARRILLPLLLALITIVPVSNLLRHLAAKVEATAPPLRGDLAEAIVTGDTLTAERLLDAKAIANQADPVFGLTPLGWASLTGNTAAIALLLDRGADLHTVDSGGNTPLHQAAYLGQASAVRLLLERGADPLARNKSGQTAVGYCLGSFEYKAAMARKLRLPSLEESKVRHGIAEASRVLLEAGSGEPPTLSSFLTHVSTCYGTFLYSDKWVVSWGGQSASFFDETLLDHLWFLWILFLFVLFLALAVRMGFAPTGKFLWFLPPLTFFPQVMMGSVLGPDVWLGPLVPPPHLLLYYGLFFWFGAAVFAKDGLGTALGRHWRILLPAGLLVFFPASILLLGFPVGNALVQCAYTWCVSLGMVGLFAHFFSHLGSRAHWFSDSAYWIYLAHLPLILALQIAVLPLEWPPSMKFLLVFSTAVALLFASYRWLVRYTWIGAFLNGPRKRRRSD